MYRHAGIDIFLGGRFQGQGAGCEAVTLLAMFLFEQRGHHRITIELLQYLLQYCVAAGIRPRRPARPGAARRQDQPVRPDPLP